MSLRPATLTLMLTLPASLAAPLILATATPAAAQAPCSPLPGAFTVADAADVRARLAELAGERPLRGRIFRRASD
ncbi:MAG: hypothetical protein ACODAE_07295, partial [Gemmatimonadota bacterium]